MMEATIKPTLREARERRGIGASAVAEALGLSTAEYLHLEERPDVMDALQAFEACRFMGYSIDDVSFCADAPDVPGNVVRLRFGESR